MNDPWLDMAQDPSCLMYVNPDGWYSPLRQGVVWPGSPRNFATEPATDGREFLRRMQGAGTSDKITFEIDFENTVNNAAARIFYGTATSDPFGLRQDANGDITFFTAFAQPISQYIAYYVLTVYSAAANGGAFLVGRHAVRAEITGTNIKVSLDNVSRVNVTIVRKTPLYNTALDSNAGYIYDMRATVNDNLVWFYPSYLERIRLVTYTNVRDDRGRFEAANPSLGWSIKTGLPAGLTGTVLAKISGEVVTNSVKWNRTTATFTGLAADTLEWLLVCNATLSAGQIAYLSN